MGRERLVAVVCGEDAVVDLINIVAAARGNKEIVRVVSVERIDGFGGGGPCDGVETLSNIYDDFHSFIFGQGPPGSRFVISDILWEQNDNFSGLQPERTNGWILIFVADPEPNGFLRTKQESFSPVAAPAAPLVMKSRVFATVTGGNNF